MILRYNLSTHVFTLIVFELSYERHVIQVHVTLGETTSDRYSQITCNTMVHILIYVIHFVLFIVIIIINTFSLSLSLSYFLSTFIFSSLLVIITLKRILSVINVIAWTCLIHVPRFKSSIIQSTITMDELTSSSSSSSCFFFMGM